MSCNDLLRVKLADRLLCESRQISVGPTGPTGPSGPAALPGTTVIATIFLDFSANNTISRVYLPPGLMTNPALSAGGVFTSDVGSDLIFSSPATVALNNMDYAFPVGIQISGYYQGGGGAPNFWSPIPSGNIGNTKCYFLSSSDYSLSLRNINLTNTTGGNITRPTSGVASGFLVTVTLFFIPS